VQQHASVERSLLPDEVTAIPTEREAPHRVEIAEPEQPRWLTACAEVVHADGTPAGGVELAWAAMVGGVAAKVRSDDAGRVGVRALAQRAESQRPMRWFSAADSDYLVETADAVLAPTDQPPTRLIAWPRDFTLSGTVRAAGGGALATVAVEAPALGVAALTDRDGRYELVITNRRELDIEVVGPGYEKLRQILGMIPAVRAQVHL
jgi:hypothetical protein